MKGAQAKPTTIDEYLRRLTQGQRAALQQLRLAIKAAAPQAEECISYSIPAFRLEGRVLVWFHAASKHLSFFPGAAPIKQYESQLAKYETSKGTVRFSADAPLPAALVKKLVKARIAENAAARKSRQK